MLAQFIRDLFNRDKIEREKLEQDLRTLRQKQAQNEQDTLIIAAKGAELTALLGKGQDHWQYCADFVRIYTAILQREGSEKSVVSNESMPAILTAILKGKNDEIFNLLMKFNEIERFFQHDKEAQKHFTKLAKTNKYQSARQSFATIAAKKPAEKFGINLQKN